MGSGRSSEDQSGGGSGGSILRSILRHSGTLLRPLSEKPHRNHRIAFIWPWVGPCLRNKLNMGPWDGPGVVPGIALPDHPSPHHPGYTPPTELPSTRQRTTVLPLVNMVVGLISVGQLTSGPLFSGLWTITEVYNLLRIGRITNHSFIPGSE